MADNQQQIDHYDFINAPQFVDFSDLASQDDPDADKFFETHREEDDFMIPLDINTISPTVHLLYEGSDVENKHYSNEANKAAIAAGLEDVKIEYYASPTSTVALSQPNSANNKKSLNSIYGTPLGGSSGLSSQASFYTPTAGSGSEDKENRTPTSLPSKHHGSLIKMGKSDLINSGSQEKGQHVVLNDQVQNFDDSNSTTPVYLSPGTTKKSSSTSGAAQSLMSRLDQLSIVLSDEEEVQNDHHVSYSSNKQLSSTYYVSAENENDANAMSESTFNTFGEDKLAFLGLSSVGAAASTIMQGEVLDISNCSYNGDTDVTVIGDTSNNVRKLLDEYASNSDDSSDDDGENGYGTAGRMELHSPIHKILKRLDAELNLGDSNDNEEGPRCSIIVAHKVGEQVYWNNNDETSALSISSNHFQHDSVGPRNGEEGLGNSHDDSVASSIPTSDNRLGNFGLSISEEVYGNSHDDSGASSIPTYHNFQPYSTASSSGEQGPGNSKEDTCVSNISANHFQHDNVRSTISQQIQGNRKDESGLSKTSAKHFLYDNAKPRVAERLAAPKSRQPIKANHYVSMAEAMIKYQKNTPDRFRSLPRGRLVPEKRATSCDSRKRGAPSPARSPDYANATTTSTGRSRADSFSERKESSFRKNGGPVLPKKVELKPTVPRPFNLSCGQRARSVPKDEETADFKFRARPAPSSKGHDNAPLLKSRPQVKVTMPISPHFASDDRLKERHQKRAQTKSPEPKTVKASVTHHQKKPSRLPTATSSSGRAVTIHHHAEEHHKTTIAQPFSSSFDARQKEIIRKKEEKMKQKLDESKKNREFHANPVPKFSSAKLPKKKPVEVTHVEPFRLKSDERGAQYQEALKKKLEEEEQRLRELAQFHAQPADVVHKPPFEPERPTRIIEGPLEFHLATEKRAIEREQFDEQLREKEREEEERKREEQDVLEEQQKQEDLERRRQLVHKAQPFKAPKPFQLKSSGKALTVPHSPAFSALPSERKVNRPFSPNSSNTSNH